MSLLERELESAALSSLLTEVRAGRGGCVILEGPEGVGKSALLAVLAGAAGGAGVALGTVRATPLTREIAFGLAHRLLGPLVRARPEALRAGWARHARSLFHGGVDRLAPAAPVLEGLVALVAELARVGGPLVLTVDDAQWIDQLSLAFLNELTARRAEIGVGLAIALASTDPKLDLRPLRALGEPTAVHIAPAPLSAVAVAQLVAERLPGADPGVATTLTHASGGNPMLVIELLDLARRNGSTELRMPIRLGNALSLALDELGAESRSLAEAVAVLGEAPLRRAAALAGLAPAAADTAADGLISRHLLAPGEPVRFLAPLKGHALAATMPPFELAALHRLAAELLAAERETDEVVAEHLMRSRPGAEKWVCDVLRRAGRAALSRGDPGAATHLLARAEAEPPPAQDRDAVLLELAGARAAAGQPAAIEAFTQALAHVGDPAQRATAWHGLSRLLYAGGDFAGAAAAGARGQAELPAGAALREQLLEDELAAAELVQELRADAATRLQALLDGEPPSDPCLLAHLLSRQAFSGIRIERIAELAARAGATDPLIDPTSRGWALMFVGTALNLADRTEQATEMLDAGLARVAELGDPLAEVTLRCCRAWTRLYRGQLDLAREDLDAVMALNALGWPMVDGICGMPLVVLRLELGDLVGARDALGRIPTAGIPGRAFFDGAVAYAAGRAEAALASFQAAGIDLEQAHGVANPAVLPWRTGAALAASQLGRRSAAIELASTELAQARAVGVQRAEGIALRTLGRVTGDHASIDESVAVLESSPARLELGRSLLAAGIARRRAQRPVDARALLGRAHGLALDCGSGPLADQAIAELRATGARPRNPSRRGVAALTSTQRRVAELAAEERTTRQIAAELFLSPKTVEGHLTNVFRRLHVSSRVELKPLLDAAQAKDLG